MARLQIRLSTRSTMALVAATAAIFGAIRAVQLRDLRERCIKYHGVHAGHARVMAGSPGVPRGLDVTGLQGVPVLADDPCARLYRRGASPDRDDWHRDAAFHQAMQRHYQSRRW